MIDATTALAFSATSAALVVIPGPSVLFVVGRSLALGRRGGLLSVLGNALGMLPAIAAVALGIGAVVAASATAFLAIKLLGAAYLVFLGVQAIRHRHDEIEDGTGVTASVSAARLIGQGFVVGCTNPKTLVFFVAVLPQFVDPGAGAVPGQLAALGLVFCAVALVCDSVWAVLAGSARDRLVDSPKRRARITAGGGVMMIGLGAGLAATGRAS